MVYVSGASETNANLPLPSVFVDSVCDGLCTVTRTPATGAPVALSTTVPMIPPVVPAIAPPGKHIEKQSNAEARATRNFMDEPQLVRKERCKQPLQPGIAVESPALRADEAEAAAPVKGLRRPRAWSAVREANRVATG